MRTKLTYILGSIIVTALLSGVGAMIASAQTTTSSTSTSGTSTSTTGTGTTGTSTGTTGTTGTTTTPGTPNTGAGGNTMANVLTLTGTGLVAIAGLTYLGRKMVRG